MADRHLNKQRGVQIEVGVKVLLSGKLGSKLMFQVYPKDFKLSWLDYFKEKNPDLFNALRGKKEHSHTIMDRRLSEIRKIWKLNDKIGAFIDSFGRNYQKYNADIGILPPNTIAGRLQQSISRPTNSNSNSGIPVEKNVPLFHRNPGTSGTSRLANTVSQVRAPLASKRASPDNRSNVQGVKKSRISESSVKGISGRPYNLPIQIFDLSEIDNEDLASMANSVDSQDSQLEELLAKGVNIEEIKGAVISKMVKQLNNNMMLNIRNELQRLIANGTYMQAVRRIPLTANMLQLMFSLNA